MDRILKDMDVLYVVEIADPGGPRGGQDHPQDFESTERALREP